MKPGLFDNEDKVTEALSQTETDTAMKDFIKFRDDLHNKLTHIMISQFNELQVFLRDHLPREQLTLNLLLATWRATTIDSINTIIQAGDYCEKEYTKERPGGGVKKE